MKNQMSMFTDCNMVREIPTTETLEYKLNNNFENVDASELLAGIMNLDYQKALPIAEKILSKHHLNKLTQLKSFELQQFNVSKKESKRLLCVFKLFEKLFQQESQKYKVVNSPIDAYNHAKWIYNHYDVEVFYIMLLDTKNQIRGFHLITKGILDASLIHPREIFKVAIRENASSIILIHNHPSGSTSPSQHDTDITKRMIQAGEIMGVEIIDHIIIGDGKYLSLKESRMM